MPTQTKEQELVETEQRFWDAMKNKDGKAAADLTDDGCRACRRSTARPWAR
jgi:hypothetical protein